jgi:acetyl/propionyl-CoA carboxylase alpha subunit/acetyl-CoA carboxylase carboxyltransferase component
MFSRIAVINRGEPAVRLIRAVRELNAEFGYGIKVIALHTAAERGALFVRAADEGVLLRDKGDLGSPYLDHAELERALLAAKADACWPGWGFVSEDAGFVELCDRIGVTFIGPPAEAMRKLGDKVQAKYLAEATGVPVAPWSNGPVEDKASALEHAKKIGYPMILKARSGGGGRGIRMVFDPSELEEAIERTQSEAQKAFNDPVIFMEKLVQGGRHIEVQVIADNYGNAWGVGVRDCSIQRRNQKLIEESSSPALTAEQDAELRRGAVALVKEAGYRNAGTVEFLYQPQEKMFAFLEVNTRLQVEHPITEASTGLDLVKLQILVADGQKLEGDPPANFGHAIEARLNAEDADNDFAPSPGKVELLTLPTGPGIRVDTGIATGDEISPDYDSMVAKIIAWGRDRPEAMARLRVALSQTTVVVKNGATTKSFLMKLLDQPEVIEATADTGWLDRAGLNDQTTVPPHADAALLYVGVDVYEAEEALEHDSFLRSARGGRPRANHTVGREVELGYQGQTYSLNVGQISPRRYRVEIAVKDAGETVVEVEIDRISEFESRLNIGDRSHHVVASTTPSGYLVEVDSVSHRVSRDEGGVVRSPAPAVVVAVRAAAGTDVEAGETVMILESMKMETPVRAPYAGRVREILVGVNSQVDGGGALLRIDRIDDGAAVSTTPTVEFAEDTAAPSTDPKARALADLAAMRALIMGYDVSAARGRGLLGDYNSVRAQTPIDDPDLLRASLGTLATFADICELSRNRPAGEEESGDERVHSPREYFHSYLHSLDIEREGLPEAFRARLAAVLAHYGVTDLEPSPELEEAVFRVFLSQERVADQIPIVTGLLERWRNAVPGFSADIQEAAGEVVERLVVATRLRYPVVGDLARSIRYEAFERPLIEATRENVYTGVREQLRLLASEPDSAEYAERIEALVASPEPLIRVLAEQLNSNGAGQQAMLEAMTRRYYRIRALENVKAFSQDGRSYVTGDYELSGNRLQLISTISSYDDLPGSLPALNTLAGQVSDPANLVTDIYLAWPEAPEDGDQVSTALHAALVHQPALAGGRRITVTVCGTGENPVRQYTFRPSGDGLEEELVIRGMHPLTGQRLDLWRLKNFNGTQIPAAQGTYLFHLVAPNNPADERLVALAEVRDITPLRDADGRIVGFPAAERVLASCLESIRRVQAQRTSRQRLDNNRVFLHVWPPIEVPLSDLSVFAQLATPLTLGTGLTEITVLARLRDGDALRNVAMRFSYQAGAGVKVEVTDPPTDALAPLDEYSQKVQRAGARGTAYPYEIVPLLTGTQGSFTEYDFVDGVFAPVDRAPGQNKAGVVAGLVTTPTSKYPEGITRVALFGDPTKALGTVAVAECAIVVAAIDLAEELGVPVEWFTLSSGAKISMDSGTENMDGVARALRRIITFTQGGGEINIIVAGINVGAQPYWNAEATMLQHTKGILIMTPDSAMVLTGKMSLDYSGGVSAEDNFGLGGYDRVMGPNGEAQYWAPNLTAATEILFAHYDHAYTAPGERFPRRADSSDPLDRDVQTFPHVHPDSPFTTVGEIFSPETNKDRKKPFDIRSVINAISDQDHATLERWAGMADADTSVVVDAHLGGYPVVIVGIESRNIPRRGFLPADGPDQFTSGTLFPRSSKKTARAINSASGSRPLVVLANLSGFDGSPESLRNIQLEYGAEIGRAIVNFDGPIIFTVISRYHGGAFVVFSGALNDNMEVVAVEGSFASVIGGAPAAAVVFTRDVNTRTANDQRTKELEGRIAAATDDAERGELRVELAELRSQVRSEKLGEVAAEFEQIHNIERAREVGSVHTIIPAVELRPYLIKAVERGMAKATAGTNGGTGSRNDSAGTNGAVAAGGGSTSAAGGNRTAASGSDSGVTVES